MMKAEDIAKREKKNMGGWTGTTLVENGEKTYLAG
jgi:hypothetical protein